MRHFFGSEPMFTRSASLFGLSHFARSGCLILLARQQLLASVDLPVEMFLPQVGVQASFLFLQKKTEEEKLAAANGKEDYEVFMAIAEAVGKDRRGQPIYVRDDDGVEKLFEKDKRTLVALPDGRIKVMTKRVNVKHLDDDLPGIAGAYAKFLKKGKRV